jgi:5-methyltetrahydropteroyltriglutamate--homocysteine methyltransferase
MLAGPNLRCIRASLSTGTALQLRPPFRAEHIGSLLRPPRLLELRARAGDVGQDKLAREEDRAIQDALALQERVGLKLATDGEFRRRSYHSFFYQQLGDIRIDVVDDSGRGKASGRGVQPVAVIGSRVQWKHPIHVADYEYIRAHTSLLPKLTIPGPCVLHFRGGDAAILSGAYRDVEQFWDDIVDAFVDELEALARDGCRYVQIDETAFAKFGDPEVQAWLKARGDDWQSLIDSYIAVTNRVLERAPASLSIGMHLCRGNRGGQHHAEGSYDIVAEKLFNALNIRFYFLEYDSPRAGSFAPLRFVPSDKAIVLGLVSTKTPALEGRDAQKKRVDEAAQFIELDRLAVSPQCGFASVDTGNPLSPRDQEAKLRLVVELAEEIWGET